MEKTNVIIYENNKEICTLHLKVVPNIGDTVKTENGFFRVKERVIYTHPKCDTEDIMISVERLTKNPITGEFDHNGMVEYLERKKEEIIVEADKTRKINYEQNVNLLGVKNMTYERFLIENEKAKNKTEKYCTITEVINEKYCKAKIFNPGLGCSTFVEDPWYIVYCVFIEYCYVEDAHLLKDIFKKNN